MTITPRVLGLTGRSPDAVVSRTADEGDPHAPIVRTRETNGLPRNSSAAPRNAVIAYSAVPCAVMVTTGSSRSISEPGAQLAGGVASLSGARRTRTQETPRRDQNGLAGRFLSTRNSGW